MKKTFKKQLILFAVITVMMILALVMPASAEDLTPCPDGGANGHRPENIEVRRIDAICLQSGYTYKWCKACDRRAELPDDFTDPTGHNFVASYEPVTENGEVLYYERVRTCQNPICQREGEDEVTGKKDLPEIKNFREKATEENGEVIRYYRVEYLNTYEAPARDAANHAASYLPYCYIANNASSWVLNCTHEDGDNSAVYAPKAYTTGKKATVDNAALTPDYEYADSAEGLLLFVRENADAPEYTGETPKRGKNLTYGRYYFKEWQEAEIKDGKRIYHAVFEEDKEVTVTFFFRNYNAGELTSKTVPYGGTVKYEDLVTPVRENDQYNEYKFEGWSFVRGDDNYIASEALSGDITAYYNGSVYALFSEASRKYDVELMVYNKVISDDTAYVAYTVKDVIGGSSLRDGIAQVNPDCFKIDRDKKNVYEHNAKEWMLKKVNGDEVLAKVIIKPDSFELPESVLVTDSVTGTTKTVKFGKNETNTITIVPTYNSAYVDYSFKITILPTHFLDEDVYPDNNLLKSDILDKFVIQVTDQDGQYIAAGTTDKNGELWIRVPYRDGLLITAGMSNGKYYGEFELDLKACTTAADVERIAANGIFISPKVTQNWTDGLKKCNCICHSFLGGIVVRIYNLLYRLFNIKYVCCDDLFIVHGNVLIYTK